MEMEEKKKSSLVVFISILVALIGGVISVAYIVYKAMSNKSYEENGKITTNAEYNIKRREITRLFCI